jgi:hypothetical protein
MIQFFGLRLLLDQNPQELFSSTIIGFRIHERGLNHVVELMGRAEPKVQQIQLISEKRREEES